MVQVFKSFDTKIENGTTAHLKDNAKVSGKKSKPVREQLSEKEIRSKLREHEVELKSSGKFHRTDKKKEMTERVEAGEEATQPKSKLTNDPEDPVTREKLKDIMASGAVKFSDKERDVLSSILK